jgi:hypothetical protein
MRIIWSVLLFFTFTTWSQETLQNLAHAKMQNFEYALAIDLIEQMDDPKRNENWTHFILANSYFGIGETEKSQFHVKKVMHEGLSRIKSRWLIKAYILKYKFEKKRTKAAFWRLTFLRLEMNKYKSCSSGYSRQMFKMLICHYRSLGNEKGIKHFERQLKGR